MMGLDHSDFLVAARTFMDLRPGRIPAPAPGISKPEGGQEMQSGRIRSAVGGVDPDQNVLRAGLGIFDFNIEEAIFGEHAGVLQFVFAFHFGTATVFADELLVGKSALWITIDHPHHAVRRRIVVVPVNLLYVFAVVPLRAVYAEEAFF